MAYEVRPLELPGDLLNPLQQNGNLRPDLLVIVPGFTDQRAKMHHIAARAFVAMRAAAKREANVDLGPSSLGDFYRTYESQESLFRKRYTTVEQPGEEPKEWRNDLWYKLPDVLEAGTPGSSNHGLGLAIDIAGLNVEPTNAISTWVLANYTRFGFSHEHKKKNDPPHIRYYKGDKIPDEVTGTVDPEVERQRKIIEEDDMLPIVTNAEQFGRVPPKTMKWAVMDDGSLRLLVEQEWRLRGGLEGTPWTNAQLDIANVHP